MSTVGFFTAFQYGHQNQTCLQSLEQKIDGYFYLGGKTAKVLQGSTLNGQEVAKLVDDHTIRLSKIAKIISYFTVIIPIFLLLAKAALRLTHKVYLIPSQHIVETPPFNIGKLTVVIPQPTGTVSEPVPTTPVSTGGTPPSVVIAPPLSIVTPSRVMASKPILKPAPSTSSNP